jgi:YHS domain-containing protein
LIAQPGAAVANAAQTLCPVMPGKLVNRRLYVDYQGTRIYVCCNPCVKAVKRDPEKYLKKLRNQ